MALDDILQAIKTHADHALAAAKKAHEERMTTMRDASTRETERLLRDISDQREAKLRSLRQKGDSYAASQIKNASLNAKKRALDELYHDVATDVAKVPASKLERLLQACLDGLPNGGTIRPAASHAAVLKKLASGHEFGEPIDSVGGFLYLSKDRDIDCTFESLVERILRPETELEISTMLFA